jgi:hypothetical protein
MSRQALVEQVLQELAAETGVGELSLDASDRVTLVFDDIPVTFAYVTQPTELLWLYVDLGEVPADGTEAPVCLMQLALTTWVASVMTIGLDEEGKNAVGMTAIAVVMLKYPTLKEVVLRLIEAARPIRDHLSTHDYDAQSLAAKLTGHHR